MSKISRALVFGTSVAVGALGLAAAALAMTIAPRTEVDRSPTSVTTMALDGAPQVILQTLPAVTGPAKVGRIELALTDSGRIDPFADDGRMRELAVWIWYPAIEGTGVPAPYLPAAWAAFADKLGPLFQILNATGTNAIANARLDGRPPVVVMMPGLGLPVATYSALAEDLASHGYAVIGINPTGSTDVAFPDGHVALATELGGIPETMLADVDAWYAAAKRITMVWAEDAAFVVGSLAATPLEIGALDFDHVAYVGHSVGGAAAFEACHLDQLCAGAVDLDGTLWTEVRNSGLAAPSLVLRQAPSEECDEFCRRAAAGFANVLAAGGSQLFAIAGSLHMSFTDLAQMPLLGTIGTIDPERMILIMRDMVRSFLDVHVRNAPPATLAAATARHPELR